VVFTAGFFGACFYAEYIVQDDYSRFEFKYINWVVIGLITIAIEVFSAGYLVLSENLTNQENHKTETNYEDALIMKTLFFKLFNNYGALIFTAFFKGPFLGTCSSSCIIDLQNLLYGIFILRFGIRIWKLASPYFRQSYLLAKVAKAAENAKFNKKDINGDDVQTLQSGTYGTVRAFSMFYLFFFYSFCEV
jgi:Calcium-activated chloride channel